MEAAEGEAVVEQHRVLATFMRVDGDGIVFAKSLPSERSKWCARAGRRPSTATAAI